MVPICLQLLHDQFSVLTILQCFSHVFKQLCPMSMTYMSPDTAHMLTVTSRRARENVNCLYITHGQPMISKRKALSSVNTHFQNWNEGIYKTPKECTFNPRRHFKIQQTHFKTLILSQGQFQPITTFQAKILLHFKKLLTQNIHELHIKKRHGRSRAKIRALPSLLYVASHTYQRGASVNTQILTRVM